MQSIKAQLQDLLDSLASARSVMEATAPLIAIGQALGLARPSVVEDYAVNTLLTVEDGRTLAEIFGWEPMFIEEWVVNKLHRINPIGRACRTAVRPFAWSAAAVTEMVGQIEPRSKATWYLRPERGIVGGISAPVHLPFGRSGGVTWFSFDEALDLDALLAEHSNALRLAAALFMDQVHLGRAETTPSDDKRLLTERELECLTWVALGKTDIEIGLIIGRAPVTARFHIEKAMEQLGANNRARAVAMAVQLGLIRAIG